MSAFNTAQTLSRDRSYLLSAQKAIHSFINFGDVKIIQLIHILLPTYHSSFYRRSYTEIIGSTKGAIIQSLDHRFNHGINSASRSHNLMFSTPTISEFHSVTLIITEKIGAQLNHGNFQSSETKQTKTSDPTSSHFLHLPQVDSYSCIVKLSYFSISAIPSQFR